MSTSVETVDPICVYFVVNQDLKMRTGKVAAQVGHAAMELQKMFHELTREQKKTWQVWESQGKTKIVLKASLTQFEQLRKLADIQIVDEGRTQIAKGSCTVLCWIPGNHPSFIKELKLL